MARARNDRQRDVQFCTVVIARPKQGIIAGWETPFETVAFDITSRRDGVRSFSAESDLLGGAVVGVGWSRERAIDDFADAVSALLDAHTANGTYQKFMADLMERSQKEVTVAAAAYPATGDGPWMRSVINKPELPPLARPVSRVAAAGSV